MDQVTIGVQLSYHGAPFSGFAKQPGDLPTVQGNVEAALRTLFRQEVPTVCAGRTDAGVHARDQWVSFQVPREAYEAKGDAALRRSLDALTSPDISIIMVERKPDGFSARFDARTREYRYFIATSQHCPVLLRQVCWHVRQPLDVDAMQRACPYLVGEHDFKSFCMQASAEGKNTVRTVLSLSVEPVEVLGETLLCVRIVGNAFLHSMVRTIVGTLVLVGRGKRQPEWVAQVLEARSRGAAGEKAPACGLVFWRVDYDDKRFMSAAERRALEDGQRREAEEEGPAEAEAAPDGASARQAGVADPDVGPDVRNARAVEASRAVEVGDAQQLPSEKDGFVEAARIRDEELPGIMDSLDLSGFDDMLDRLTREADEAMNRSNRVTDPLAKVGDAPAPLQQRDSYAAAADPHPAQEESLVVERRMDFGVGASGKKRRGLRDLLGRDSSRKDGR